jgi:hypothetical protein
LFGCLPVEMDRKIGRMSGCGGMTNRAEAAPEF